MRLVIVAAAIKYPEGVVSVPAPGRHHDVIALRLPSGGPTSGSDVQGFITDTGEFLDRVAAGRHAYRAEQIEELKWPPYLYSEDLW